MTELCKYFPLSATVQPKDGKSLLVTLLIYLTAGAVMGILNAILGWIPIVGWILGIVFSLLGLYCAAGIVLAILRYFQH